MNTRAITTLFVVDEASRPVGILHIHDLLRAVSRERTDKPAPTRASRPLRAG